MIRCDADFYFLVFSPEPCSTYYFMGKVSILPIHFMAFSRNLSFDTSLIYFPPRFRIIQGSGSGNEFWFFNTHLPHPHGQSTDRNTHSIIAKMLLDKRAQLGAGNSPSIVTGDCNPFASAGARKGSFESNLAAGGIVKVYEATGSTGGLVGFDKIFASRDWTWSNAADVGTGSSDHPAIVVDLTL